MCLFGCRSSAPPPPTLPTDAGAAPTTASVAPPASAAPSAQPDDVVTKWNDAHVKHDAAALEALYASSVVFYGVRMTSGEAAKKKAAAFASTPGFTQTVSAATLEESDEPGVVWARFTKTTAGKSFPALLIVDASHRIREEADDVTQDPDWCRQKSDGMENDRVVYPFRLGAEDAIRRTLRSKTVAGVQGPKVAVGNSSEFSCAKRCAKASRDCDFTFKLHNMLDTTSVSKTITWAHVDPLTAKLYWSEYATTPEQL